MFNIANVMFCLNLSYVSNARGSRKFREHVEAVGRVWLPSKGIKVIFGLCGNPIGDTLVAPVTNANMSLAVTPHSVKITI